MKRFFLYLITAFFFFLTLNIGLSAYHNFLFWQVAYLDIAMHFLAGMTVGLVGAIFYFSIILPHIEREVKSLRDAVIVSALTALLVGVIWELFEFSVDEFWTAEFTVKQLAILKFSFGDTISDLLFDLLGGFIAGFIFWALWRDSKQDFIKDNEENI